MVVSKPVGDVSNVGRYPQPIGLLTLLCTERNEFARCIKVRIPHAATPRTVCAHAVSSARIGAARILITLMNTISLAWTASYTCR